MNRRFAILCLHVAVALILGACNKPAAEAPAPAASEAAPPQVESERRTVQLRPDNIAKMGIAVSTAEAAQYAPETEGFGVILSHEPIAQAIAEAAVAEAAVRQSRAALTRSQRLAGTAGADSAESLEMAQRQASTDEAAAQLAARRLSSMLGQKLPWTESERRRILDDIASGRRKIVRATFPLGARTDGAPQRLRVSRLDAATAEEQWTARPVWAAPADMNVPGRSFFGLLPKSEAAEGERLTVWAESAGRAAGAWIPASAAIISEGRYWVYVERASGVYVRTPLDIGHPLRDGYLTERDIKPGDRIVSNGAGLLLARELNPSSAVD
jgi:hypothetical protein